MAARVSDRGEDRGEPYLPQRLELSGGGVGKTAERPGEHGSNGTRRGSYGLGDLPVGEAFLLHQKDYPVLLGQVIENFADGLASFRRLDVLGWIDGIATERNACRVFL